MKWQWAYALPGPPPPFDALAFAWRGNEVEAATAEEAAEVVWRRYADAYREEREPLRLRDARTFDECVVCPAAERGEE